MKEKTKMNLSGEKNNKSKRNGIGMRRIKNNSLQKVENEKLSDEAEIIYDELIKYWIKYPSYYFNIKNQELSEMTGINVHKISDLFGELKKKGYIICDYEFDKDKKISVRRIHIP